MHQNIIHLALACSITLLVTSCKKDIDPVSDAPGQGQDISMQQKLMAYFHLPADAVVRDAGGWVVDGDVFVSDEAAANIGTGSKQARISSGLITAANQGNITVSVSSSVESGWATAMTQAIAEWNAAPNCAIQISEVSGGADMYVRMSSQGELGTNTIARGDYPYGTGNVGPLIRINPAFNYYSAAQKKRTMAHELGHTLGFMHTNTWQADALANGITGQAIPGTPDADPSSLMNSGQGGTNWNGFSFYDKYMAALTYPETTPISGTQLLYFYVRVGNTVDYFYTQDWRELGGRTNSPDWNYVHIPCCTLTQPLLGTVPLRRYRWLTGQNHYYTTDPIVIPPGAIPEGNVGYVYTTQQAGTVPLYRYGGLVSWTWFLATSDSPPSYAWRYPLGIQLQEQLLGYVYPPPIPVQWPS